MSADKPPREPIDYRAGLFSWATSQGPSTTLLCLICVGLWYGIPWARTCMKEDMQQIHEAHKASIDALIKSADTHIEKTIEAFTADQERDQRVMDRLIEKQRVASGESQ